MVISNTLLCGDHVGRVDQRWQVPRATHLKLIARKGCIITCTTELLCPAEGMRNPEVIVEENVDKCCCLGTWNTEGWYCKLPQCLGYSVKGMGETWKHNIIFMRYITYRNALFVQFVCGEVYNFFFSFLLFTCEKMTLRSSSVQFNTCVLRVKKWSSRTFSELKEFYL